MAFQRLCRRLGTRAGGTLVDGWFGVKFGKMLSIHLQKCEDPICQDLPICFSSMAEVL